MSNKRNVSENMTIIDYGRIGHVNTPDGTLPRRMISTQGIEGGTFLDMLARNIYIDPTLFPITDFLIEAIVDALLAPRDSAESTVNFIDTFYLSEQSFLDEHTEQLLDSLQERQGLSPLNVLVWYPDTESWEKVRPVNS